MAARSSAVRSSRRSRCTRPARALATLAVAGSPVAAPAPVDSASGSEGAGRRVPFEECHGIRKFAPESGVLDRPEALKGAP